MYKGWLRVDKVDTTKNWSDIFTKVLRDLGFNDETVCDLVEKGSGYAEFEERCGRHAYCLISELHNGTWSVPEYTHGVLESNNGTLAGTAAADIVFTLVASKIMNEIENKFKDESLCFLLIFKKFWKSMVSKMI